MVLIRGRRMKGRSQRLAAAAAPEEDWSKGGWTVACSCGATNDDGKEMVSCDKCGVWVHTLCSGFVRGRSSFACHKCFRLAEDASKETESAQLLVEFPTKANPAHFNGMSPIISAQLWKCAGYIPKKFNFKYREFPCWDEEEKKGNEEEDGQNPAKKGADLMFTLSKKTVSYVPARNFQQMLSPEITRNRDFGKGFCGYLSWNINKKERSKLRVPCVQYAKRSRYEIGVGKHECITKKARSCADKSKDNVCSGSVPILDMNRVDSCEDIIPQVEEAKVQDWKIKDGRGSLSSELKVTNQKEVYDSGRKSKNIVMVKTQRGRSSDEISKRKGPEELELLQNDKHANLHQIRVEGLFNVNISSTSRGEETDDWRVLDNEEDIMSAHSFREPKAEVHSDEVGEGDRCPSSREPEDSEPVCAGMLRRSSDSPDTSTLLVVETSCFSSKLDKINVKAEREDDQTTCKQQMETCQSADKMLEVDRIPQSVLRLADHTHNDVCFRENTKSSPAQEHKQQIAERKFMFVYKRCEKNGDKVFSKSSLNEGPAATSKEEESGNYVHGETTPPVLNENNSLISICRLSLESQKGLSATTERISISSGICNVTGAIECSTTSKATDPFNIQQAKLVEGTSEEKDDAKNAVSSEETFPTKIQVEDYDKGVSCISFKPSDSGFAGVSTSTQAHASSVLCKLKPSISSLKSERLNPPNSQPLNKLSHSATTYSSAPVNATSDEEIALLLHQELNSSHRVSRVPCIRQAAGQLVPPTGSSILSKRSSTSGAKDHASVPKRKGKEDQCRYSSRDNLEVIGEIKRIGRLNSSRDHKHDSVLSPDASKNDAHNRSPDSARYVKKNIPVASTAGGNCSLLEVNGEVSSLNKGVSDDVVGLAFRTLPGLIGEIIGRNKDVTLDELCDAVGPTDSNNKRRKLDVQSSLIDTESEDSKYKVLKAREDKDGESYCEAFRRDKHKARKHRRRKMELQGRVMKDRKMQKDSLSDDNSAELSNSSNEVKDPSSDDESDGTKMHAGLAEASTSSSEEVE